MNRWRWLLPLIAAGGLAGLAARARTARPAPEGIWKDAVPLPDPPQPGAGD